MPYGELVVSFSKAENLGTGPVQQGDVLAGFPLDIWLFSLVISPQGHRKEFRSELVFRSQSEVRVSI